MSALRDAGTSITLVEEAQWRVLRGSAPRDACRLAGEGLSGCDERDDGLRQSPPAAALRRGQRNDQGDALEVTLDGQKVEVPHTPA